MTPSNQTHELSAAAERLARRLCRDAIWFEQRCNWLSAGSDIVDRVVCTTHRNLGGDLYGGTSGIALSLAAFAACSGEGRSGIVQRTVHGSAQHALGAVDRFHPSLRLSAHAGLLGLAFALSEVDRLLEEDRYADAVSDLIEAVSVTEEPSDENDLISGRAGRIPLLLDLYSRTRDERLLSMAVKAGESLLSCAHSTARGMSWCTAGATAENHLLGLAHGASGVAWALLELGARVDSKYFAAAEAAMSFERSHFDLRAGGWPDRRSTLPSAQPGAPPIVHTAWCHGSVGIGLVRQRAFELTGRAVYAAEAELAYQGVLGVHRGGTPESSNFSLCHGYSGDAELLLTHSQSEGRAPDAARGIMKAGIARFEAAGLPWPGGADAQFASAGLMLGDAGILYTLLRVAEAGPLRNLLLPGLPLSEARWSSRATSNVKASPLRTGRTAPGQENVSA
jgi:lantibiotic biosynthesis protein